MSRNSVDGEKSFCSWEKVPIALKATYEILNISQNSTWKANCKTETDLSSQHKLRSLHGDAEKRISLLGYLEFFFLKLQIQLLIQLLPMTFVNSYSQLTLHPNK